MREELRRVPRRNDERRRLDVAVFGVQLTDDLGIDEQQVADEVDVAARHGRVAVKDPDAVHR